MDHNNTSMTPPPRRSNPAHSPGGGYLTDSSPTRLNALLRRQTSSRSGGTPQTPDRFIPTAASIQSFRINTPGGRRSEDERRSRRRSASPNGSRSSRSRSISAQRVGVGSYTQFSARRVPNQAVTGSVDVTSGIHSSNQGFIVTAQMTTDDTALQEESEMHEERIALALGVDLGGKVMSYEGSSSPEKRSPGVGGSPVKTELSAWSPNSPQMEAAAANLKRRRSEMLLDAPGLRDDFYCTLLAYSATAKVLAVALGCEIYGWTERGGAKPFKPWAHSQITAIAFSSTSGKLDILAVGRVDGVISLWGLGESAPRAEAQHQAAVACVSFKPFESKRRGLSSRKEWTRCEDLLLGDESGNIYFYAIEWDPEPGSTTCGMTLVRRMKVHSQQICGIAWSMDATQVATGGNDNQCILFDVESPKDDGGDSRDADEPNRELIIRHKWQHQAAVKAIAFCPWQKSLIATGTSIPRRLDPKYKGDTPNMREARSNLQRNAGGGSNDRGIHFYHTFTGASIATIQVSAQVTSLIWSTQRKEIAATFGYANPEHPIRIAVFTWPDCHKVVSVPWAEDMRALYALQYPGGPPESRNGRQVGTSMGPVGDSKYEGCLVVAASDETIRFHEVWGVTGTKQKKKGGNGALGSDILETLEGIEREGRERIR